jgi:3-methyladenine DNA glycosylase/8-oxoguanine DNA glycosylase
MKARFYYVPADAIAHLRARDELLARAMDRVGPFVLEPRATKSLFEALMRSITYQQLHGKAAATIHGRVIAQLKAHGGATPEALEKVSDEALRGAGLSGSKLRAIRDLARKCLDGTVPTLREAHRLDDAELVARLTEVRGIGPWTVHMLLIFYLGRPDVLPTGDLAIRAAFKRLYNKRRDPSPEALTRHARRWQPYRSVACWYLWRSLDTAL